jgi:hypothetical protein
MPVPGGSGKGVAAKAPPQARSANKAARRRRGILGMGLQVIVWPIVH